MEANGKTLSMHSKAIYKGDETHNGTLLKLHENSFTIGYSALLTPDGTAGATVNFGDGVFYNVTAKNNKVYAGAPTVADATSGFAGIIVREPAIASGYPAINDEVSYYQKGLLLKEGYVIYKAAYTSSALAGAAGTRVSAFTNAKVGDLLVIAASNGKPYVATSAASGDTTAGKIIAVNPDDQSVTVFVSPAYYAA